MFLFHSIVGMVSKLQSKSSLNSIHCDIKYYCSVLIMYTKTHNVWSTVNISIVIIIKLNTCCVVINICTKTPSTWPTLNFVIEVIIIFNINRILVKPLSHGVFLTIYICYRLTWWPNTHLGCFKLHHEYSMSASQKKPPIFTSWYPSFFTQNHIYVVYKLWFCTCYNMYKIIVHVITWTMHKYKS
jgi:hypothetical protein